LSVQDGYQQEEVGQGLPLGWEATFLQFWMHQIEIHTNQVLPKLSYHTKPTIMSSTSKIKTNHPSPSHFIPSQPPRPLLLTLYPPLVSLPLRLRTAKPNRSLPNANRNQTDPHPTKSEKSRPKKPPLWLPQRPCLSRLVSRSCFLRSSPQILCRLTLRERASSLLGSRYVESYFLEARPSRRIILETTVPQVM